MIPGLIYRIDFQNFDSDFVRVDISDTTVQIADDATPQVILLRATGDPLRIKVIDNDEDKFTPIRAKQAVIQFISEPSYNIGTFADGSDNRFTVQVILNPTTTALTVFVGFLVLSDLQQTFQPDPQTVVLTASDHLGVLKDIPLSNDDDTYIKGKYRIAFFIAQCLKKTGLSLPIRVMNNIRHGGGSVTILATFNDSPNQIIVAITNFFYVGQTVAVTGTASNNGTFVVTAVGQSIITIVQTGTPFTDETEVTATFTDQTSIGHFYDKVYLDALTFEKAVSSAESAYETLERILGDDCFVTQYNGAWWICRVDEYDDNLMYLAQFSAEGEYLSIAEVTDMGRSVGAAEAYQAALADMLLRLDRPLGYIQEIFRFNSPAEIICNINYERGEFIENLPPVTVDEIAYTAKSYQIDCFTYAQHKSKGASPTPATGQAYIKRLFYNDQERDRYIRIDGITPANPFIYSLKSEAININKLDKFIVSLSTRWSNTFDASANIARTIAAELQGDDGTYWYLTRGDSTSKGYWFQYVPGSNYILFISNPVVEDTDFTQWQNNSYESNPAPVSGKLYIYIGASNESVTTYVEHSSFNFEYLPYINGSYARAAAQYHKVSRPLTEPGYIAKREHEVYISDSPSKSLKGAMFIVTYEPLFSGSALFAPPDVIVLSGDQRGIFYPGQEIVVDGTASNDGPFTVTSVVYHVVGDTTDIIVTPDVVSETIATDFLTPDYPLTNLFYRGNLVALGNPVNLTTDLKPFGYHQAFAVWNQSRNSIRKFSGSVLHLGELWPDIIHKYSLTDANQNTNNRYFLLISFDQDWKSCLSTCTFVEVFNSVTGKTYSDPWEFKFIDQ